MPCKYVAADFVLFIIVLFDTTITTLLKTFVLYHLA